MQLGGVFVSNIQAQCERMAKTFPITLQENPQAAAYMLGSLYRFLPKQKSEEKKQIIETINNTKEKLSKGQVVSLWNEFNKLSSNDWNVLPKGNRKSLIALRLNMLRDSRYFQYIDNEQLIKFGQNIEFTREVLIALVRKDLMKNKHSDPFKRDFNYELLKIGGEKENHPYLYPFFNRCSIVPVDKIGSLGEKNVKIAEIILKDLSTTSHFFAVSAKLAEYHPKLRSNIAKDWNKVTATHPLSPQLQKTLPETLDKLKKEYPEFKKVKIDTRLERIQPRGENKKPIPIWQHITGGVVGAGIGYTGVKASVCLCAAPAFLPLYFVAAGAGVGYACSQSKTVNDWGRKAQRKIKNWFRWN